MLEKCLYKDNEAYLKCFSADMFSGKRIVLSPTATFAMFILLLPFVSLLMQKCLEFHVFPPFAKAILGRMCNQEASERFSAV